ncbi:MAG TPA: acyl-CoA dehydrogenase [Anaerolineae bacterium]|nr:acyl-CoA dehydrogenase [Anaerolineae bacterium]
MSEEWLHSPTAWLQSQLPAHPLFPTLTAYEQWWEEEGKAISAAVDAHGTPWLRMFDSQGRRIDLIDYPPDYDRMLKQGYRAGHVWRVFEENSLLPFYLLGYVTSFYDPGLYCPYTVSLGTAIPLAKYGDDGLKARYLPPLLRRDEAVWQGATWMTEIKGGSDLGAAVETVARRRGDRWLLTGDKYFASNAHAELAVIAARPEGAPHNVRGLALFLAPRFRSDGELNYFIRRLKDKIGTRSVPTGEVELRDSEAYLIGRPEWGIYQILEVLNVSRVANSVASVALLQRALSDAASFARERIAFGKPIIAHPLLRQQFDTRKTQLRETFALAWEAVRLLDEVWQETPRYSDRYHLFRLVAHLAKYWTAEVAVQAAKWAMEVFAGLGVLAEFRVERWWREAMILQIWEGTPHRQILDGVEVMERKRAHELLFQHVQELASQKEIDAMRARVEAHLALPVEEKEARAEELFRDLAQFTARSLARQPVQLS